MNLCIRDQRKATSSVPPSKPALKRHWNLRKTAKGSKVPPKRPTKSSQLQLPGFRPSAWLATNSTTRGPTSSPSTTPFPTSKEKRATRLLLLLRPIAAWRQHRPFLAETSTTRLTSFSPSLERVVIKGHTLKTKKADSLRAAPVWVPARLLTFRRRQSTTSWSRKRGRTWTFESWYAVW